MDYLTVKLNDADIRAGAYKQYLGGGRDHWEKRGAFQLYFLRQMGLKPTHHLLDVGCGPLRAGVHLIRYLSPGHYCGVDYNADFLRAADDVVRADPDLLARSPRLERVDGFDFSHLNTRFSHVLLFSVLNHCAPVDRQRFFEQVERVTTPGKQRFISPTRIGWRRPCSNPPVLGQHTAFHAPQDIAPGLDMNAWGWADARSLFPILELAAA